MADPACPCSSVAVPVRVTGTRSPSYGPARSGAPGATASPGFLHGNSVAPAATGIVLAGWRPTLGRGGVLQKTNEDIMYERLYKTESQLVDAFFRLDQLIPGQIASVQAKVNSLVVGTEMCS